VGLLLAAAASSFHWRFVMKLLALVLCTRYYSTADGRLMVSKGLRLVERDPRQEIKNLRRSSRLNFKMAADHPGRTIYLTTGHQQFRAAALLEKEFVLQPSA
jgi:hypothetical protein